MQQTCSCTVHSAKCTSADQDALQRSHPKVIVVLAYATEQELVRLVRSCFSKVTASDSDAARQAEGSARSVLKTEQDAPTSGKRREFLQQ
eukprot:154470-Amphidinium_carterae.1